VKVIWEMSVRTRFSIFKNIVSLRVEPDIDDESYFTEIKNANYVLCTYSPKTYRLRGSGLMMDALAIGTPVVCTAGVGALEHVDRENRDAIEIVQSYSAFSVLKGLRQATMKADFRQSIAKNASKVFRERMDPDHWFEMMTAA
jgi:hypothetical protein